MRPDPLLPVSQEQPWYRWLSSSIVFDVGIALGGVVIARFMSGVTQILLARWMGEADFGVYSMAYALLTPVIVITGLGLDTWLLRQSSDEARLPTAISQVFSLRLLSSLALMGITILVIEATMPEEVPPLILLMAGISLVFELLLMTAHIALRAQLRNQATALLQMLVAALLLLLCWLAWLPDAPLLAVTGYRLLSMGVGVLLLLWLLRESLHFFWQPAPMLAMLGQARAFVISDILAAISLRADLTLVALFLGSAATAIYSPALTIITMTYIIPTVAWQVLLPVISRQRQASNLRGFRWTLGLTLAGSVLYGLLWVVVLGWQAEWVVQMLYNNQYGDVVPLLHITSLMPLFKSLAFCGAMVMVAGDRHVLRTKLQAIGSAFNGLSNLLLIPLFGLLAAAWINMLTQAILVVVYSYGVWVTLRHWNEPGSEPHGAVQP